MRAIESASAATFTEIQLETGLPKATLARALKTLQESKWIQFDDENARYSLNLSPSATASSLRWRDQVANAALAARETLQQKVPWPNDLGVRDGLAMLSIDGPHARNSLSANFKVLGSRPSMLRSSLGRCYLAYCPRDEREEILEHLRRSRSSADREGAHAEEVARMIDQVKKQGYATRNARYTSADSPERFGAMAVPVLVDGYARAALCIVWIPAISDERSIADSFLDHLKSAAAAIALRLNSCK